MGTNRVAIAILVVICVLSLALAVAVLAVYLHMDTQWKQELDEQAKTNAKLSSDLKKAEDKVNSLGNGTTVAEVENLTKKNAKLNENLQTKISENAKLAENLNDKTAEVGKLNIELQKAKQGIEQKTSENVRLNVTLRNRTSEHDKLAVEKAQLTTRLQQAKDEIDQLEKKNTGLDNELTKEKAEVAQLEAKIKSIPCQISCDGVDLKEIAVPTAGGGTNQRNVSMDGDWIVIQKNKDSCQSFINNWDEYVAGFGSPCGGYWLGLEAIHQLTKNGDYQLRIDMIEKSTGNHLRAQYSTFKLEPASDKYRLTVDGFSGNATDGLNGGSDPFKPNGMQFSTFNSDNDPAGNVNCAANTGGGWWHNSCSKAALNGNYKYNFGVTWQNTDTGAMFLLSYTEMKIKRR